MQYYPQPSFETATFEVDESLPGEAILEARCCRKKTVKVEPQIFYHRPEESGTGAASE